MQIRLFALFMEKRLRRHGFPLLLTAVFTVCAMTDACIRRRINLLKGVTVTPLKNRIWKLIPLVFIIPATMVIIRLCRDTAGYELLLGLMGVLFAGAVREYIVNFPQVTGNSMNPSNLFSLKGHHLLPLQSHSRHLLGRQEVLRL